MVVAMISYDEHEQWLLGQKYGFEAELAGFRQAKIGNSVSGYYDHTLQARFEKGYADGQAKLLQDSILTTKGKEE
jgi:hypothetical protein